MEQILEQWIYMYANENHAKCLKQVAQWATIAHLSPMCQGQISFQKNIYM